MFDSRLDPAAPTPRVSVVVPHYSDLERLGVCLAALERQTLPRQDFEIIVADNTSPEGEAAVARVIAGRARLIIVPERGAGPARNGGVGKARGEILAFTDSDCLPEPGWLKAGVEALSTYDFVGGRMDVLVDDPRAMTPEEAFEMIFAFRNESYVKDQGFTVTANLLCRAEVFAEVGGFVSSGLSEDCEWCYRARDKGYRIGYAPDAIVGHPARKTWDELLTKWRRTNTEMFGLAVRGRNGRLKWFIRSLALPASAVVHTPRALLHPEVDVFDQRLRAVAVLFRLRFWRLGDSLRLLMAKP